MVGTDRFRVIDWEQGAIPERRFREKLAQLAGGGATADDFTVNADEQSRLVEAITAVAPTRGEEFHRELQRLREELAKERRAVQRQIKKLREAS